MLESATFIFLVIKQVFDFLRNAEGNFPGRPVVKTSPSNAEGVGSIPNQGVKIPPCLTA